tara:strand:+ start:98 stop:421 length:324 start_codon:yes stop_codon:yes gene_type:complete
MARFYKASNKRLIARGRNGRFRKTTLSDIGMAECETCGKIFFPDYDAAVGDDPFVDHRLLQDAKRFCGNHGGVEKTQHQEHSNQFENFMKGMNKIAEKYEDKKSEEA